MVIEKKKVGLCVTGGIAAYKAVELMRLLQKSGCEVRVAMTRHASEFVTPLTFRALSGHYVIVDDYDPSNPDPIAHINFSQEIDLLLVAPATANIIAKFANGVADDFVSSTYLASNAPVMIAPAMNTTMWDHPSTQRNIERLKSDGVLFVEPVSGELACRTIGTGKLEDVENIARQAVDQLGSLPSGKESISEPAEQDLAGEHFLITVGGTREPIDPVRYISNRSSGKMGFAVAERARERGARVTVIAGSYTASPPGGIRLVEALSAEEMFSAVKSEVGSATVFVGAAAVADFRPREFASAKIKKQDRETYSLELEKTEDILAHVASNRSEGLIVAGFAAESNDLDRYAREKLERKDLDLVVANDISLPGAGFNSDTNAAKIYIRGVDQPRDWPIMPKLDLADRVIDEIVAIRQSK